MCGVITVQCVSMKITTTIQCSCGALPGKVSGQVGTPSTVGKVGNVGKVGKAGKVCKDTL